MSANVDMAKVVPAQRMVGEDDDETCQLRETLEEARTYLSGFGWCRGIRDEFFGLGVGGVVAVFLFCIEPAAGVDEWLWVISGDLPSAYLVIDKAKTPSRALELYCDMMEDWAKAVRSGEDVGGVFPVSAAATAENAALLERRISFLRKEVVPMFD